MRRTRQGILFVVASLICLGIVMIYSASAVYAQERLGDSLYFLKRHLVYLALGIILGAAVMTFDYTKLKRWSKPFLLLSLAVLVLVLVPGVGKEISGARRWFKIGSFGIQPSEIAKVALLVYLSEVLSRKQARIESFFQGLLPPLMALGMIVGLILLEPDLGTAVALCLVSVILFFVSGVRGRVLLSLAAAALPAVYLLIFHVAYRRKRILAFLNPWADPQGFGFQIIQSFIALGSGGLFGVGLGRSQQKLFYLPQSHTDFVFAILGEELGLLGTLGVIALFWIFLWLGIEVALRAKDLFGQFLALGLTSLVALEALINIAVVTGSIPTKGLPLPFVSYGGSALVVNCIAVGLLLNIAKHRLAEPVIEELGWKTAAVS